MHGHKFATADAPHSLLKPEAYDLWVARGKPAFNTWVAQFMEIPMDTFPLIPEDWTDLSWRHNPLPEFKTPGGCHVLVDYAAPQDREMAAYHEDYEGEGGEIPYVPRFTVYAGAPDADTPILIETDDWATVLTVAAAHASP